VGGAAYDQDRVRLKWIWPGWSADRIHWFVDSAYPLVWGHLPRQGRVAR
jgi:hypothetical protein